MRRAHSADAAKRHRPDLNLLRLTAAKRLQRAPCRRQRAPSSTSSTALPVVSDAIGLVKLKIKSTPRARLPHPPRRSCTAPCASALTAFTTALLLALTPFDCFGPWQCPVFLRALRLFCITAQITAQVTAQVTVQVTAQVTMQVTAQVTMQVTAQVTVQVTVQGGLRPKDPVSWSLAQA